MAFTDPLIEVQRDLLDEAATQALGAELAVKITQGLVTLSGTLGAGKTTLVRGWLRALGYQGPVKSPTYTLVEPYEIGGVHLYHFDLYRLSDPEELELMGFRDYLTAESLCLIEWPERGQGFLPSSSLHLDLQVTGQTRRATIRDYTGVTA